MIKEKAKARQLFEIAIDLFILFPGATIANAASDYIAPESRIMGTALFVVFMILYMITVYPLQAVIRNKLQNGI